MTILQCVQTPAKWLNLRHLKYNTVTQKTRQLWQVSSFDKHGLFDNFW